MEIRTVKFVNNELIIEPYDGEDIVWPQPVPGKICLCLDAGKDFKQRYTFYFI